MKTQNLKHLKTETPYRGLGLIEEDNHEEETLCSPEETPAGAADEEELSDAKEEVEIDKPEEVEVVSAVDEEKSGIQQSVSK